MNHIIFSLLHATWHRPEKAVAAMRLWLARAINPEAIEYLVAVNDDDEATAKAFLDEKAIVVNRPYRGSAPAWNDAARYSSGDLLVQVSDDFDPPCNWDVSLLEAIERGTQGNWLEKPMVVAVSDGYRTDSLLCMFICNREYYELEGYFLHPSFRSVFSDDHATFRALKRARDGEAILVNARHLVFKHEHHYHNPDIPMDETYKRQNSDEAYRSGVLLFESLNPDWKETGLVDWRK